MDLTPVAEAAAPALGPALDHALARLQAGAAQEGFDALVAELAQARRQATAEEWAALIAQARAHPVRSHIHLDPFAYRCFAHPRGYAGDGIALDYVLRPREPAARGDDPVAALHHATTNGQVARALRFRRDAIAREVDAAAANAPAAARVFAAGAGHLRECERMQGLRSGRIARLVAFDTDANNLDHVRREYARLPVVTHLSPVRQLIEGRHLFHGMDVAYTAGLLETLPKPGALALVRALFALLAPGGTLVATHFLPGLDEAAFLEAFLDWRMVYRPQGELHDLVKALPEERLAAWTYSENDESTLAVLVIRRR